MRSYYYQLNSESTYSPVELRKIESLMIMPLIARETPNRRAMAAIPEKARTTRVPSLLDHSVRVRKCAPLVLHSTQSFCGAAFAMCCWPIRSFRAESHAARTGFLLVSPTFLSLAPLPCPTTRVRFPPGPAGSSRPLFRLSARTLSSFPRRCRPASHGPSPF